MQTDLSLSMDLGDKGLSSYGSRDRTIKTQDGFFGSNNPEIGCLEGQGWCKQDLKTDPTQGSGTDERLVIRTGYFLLSKYHKMGQ